jgi:LPS sulfotransferase NodH
MSVFTKISPSVRNTLVNAAGLLPRPKVGRLCILTNGRTGSELLVELLDSHPKMRCESEILRDPQRDALRFVRGRTHSAWRHGAKAYGFKFITGQARSLGWRRDLPAFLTSLSDDGFIFVRLRRRSLLRQALSTVRARQARDWHTREEGNRGAAHVDPVQLIFTMRNLESLHEYLDTALPHPPAFDLVYEEDLEDEERRPATLSALFTAVGLEPAAPTSTLRKQTPTSLADAIENLDEVTTALRTTRYARHLED